jgi:predicted ribosome quality control (RQC) complex YloA/Tae2 family protein
VPVIVTRKKYVRKPKKGPPGLALCTHEKTVMVRPSEPETPASN